MTNKSYFLSLLVLVLILIGAGCAQTDQQKQPTEEVSEVEKQIKKDIEEAAKKQKEREKPQGNISLKAEPRQKGAVHFEWSVPEDKKVNRFVIVRDEKANPVHDGKNYWFRQPGSRREVTWIDIPSGTYHFRICILENNECTEYSNDVKVKVK